MSKEAALSEKDMDVEINSKEVDATAPDTLFIEPAEERRLLRKLDRNIISIMGALYLLAFLDRANIGNANVAGLSEDLGLTGNQFGTAVSIVYATYVAFEPVWANLLKIVTPRLLLSLTTAAWGFITLGTAFVKTYEHLITARVILGVFEAGLFPCVNLYLAMSYRREELATRLSYIFACAALSGALGGLLAYGLTQINAGSLVGWQWLYLIEGVITICFVPVAYLVIPNLLTEAWFLNKRERALCAIRYEINKEQFDPSEQFSWREVRLAASDWKTWSHAANQFCVDVTLYGLSTFMPIIIRGLQLTTNPVYAQLLTVPVYFVAAASFLFGARMSDKYQCRSVPMLVYSVIAIIGYIILATVESPPARFFGVFVVGCALYAGAALNVTWTNNNNAGHFRRATATGLMQLVGNCAGAAIGYIYSADTAPRYTKGLWVSVGITVLSMVITVNHAYALKRINVARRANIAAGVAGDPSMGNDSPTFLYYL